MARVCLAVSSLGSRLLSWHVVCIVMRSLPLDALLLENRTLCELRIGEFLRAHGNGVCVIGCGKFGFPSVVLHFVCDFMRSLTLDALGSQVSSCHFVCDFLRSWALNAVLCA